MLNKQLNFLFLFLLLTCCSLNLSANICIDINLPDNPNYQFNNDIKISSYDSTEISANLLLPTQSTLNKKLPVIIFVNSWVLDEHEYLVQAAKFAEKGYLVLSYSSRGWGCSGGVVDIVGDRDMDDLSAVIDWLIANQNIDPENIGITGISYGSGISLMGLAKEPRIKTAVAMSTWASLTDALFQHQTPRSFWGFFLVSSGLITATMDPVIARNYINLLTHQSIPETLEWAEQRSVKNFIHLINEKNAPVYLANNFGDNLFQPNNLLKFFSQLTVPKRLDLNQGTHASGEGLGLIGLDNYTWNNAHLWFDYWLKNQENGITQQPPVTMLAKTPGQNSAYQRDEYAQWPSAQSEQLDFYLGARGFFSQGKLQSSPYTPFWNKSNKIYSGLDTLATTGIPVLSALLDGHLAAPVKTKISLISRLNGIVFQSEKLDKTVKLRGIPKISLNIKPSYSKLQLNAYLYDVSGDTATLITHGPITLHNAKYGDTQKIDWELVATAYDIPAGHQIAIALDTFDILYGVPTILPYSVSFKFSAQNQSVLSLPVIH